MASELVASLGPGDLRSEGSMGYEMGMSIAKPTGMKVYGMSFAKDISGQKGASSYSGVILIPASLTMATGLTFTIVATDDGSNPADLGKVARFGVTTKVLTANATLDLDSGASLGTEQKGSVTLSATSGGTALLTIAVTTAQLGTGAAVGAALAVRVRRIGDDAADTLQGRVIVPQVYVNNT